MHQMAFAFKHVVYLTQVHLLHSSPSDWLSLSVSHCRLSKFVSLGLSACLAALHCNLLLPSQSLLSSHPQRSYSYQLLLFLASRAIYPPSLSTSIPNGVIFVTCTYFGQLNKINILLGVDVYADVLLHGRRNGPPGTLLLSRLSLDGYSLARLQIT